MRLHVQQAITPHAHRRRTAQLGLSVVLSMALTGCIFESSSSSGGGGGGNLPTLPPPTSPPPGSVITCKDYNFNDVEVAPKRITVHNNSDRQLYPVLATSKNAVNEWIQGCFRTKDPHPTEFVYKLYINEGEGIPPNSSVTITLPLYSQLADQRYITWWNGGRVVLADKDVRLRDPADTRLSAPEGVSCTAVNTACALTTYASDIQFHENVFAQLSEYTFGDSVEVAGQDVRLLKSDNVGYNISYVDHVYMPVAIGPKDNPYIGYSGSVQSLPQFQQGLARFLTPGSIGDGWPVYNLGGIENLKLPGGYNIFAQRTGRLTDDPDIPVRKPGDTNPPVLTVLKCLKGECTDAEKDAGNTGLRHGVAVQRIQNLWGKCLSWPADEVADYIDGSPAICDADLTARLENVKAFFKKNHDSYVAMYNKGLCPDIKKPEDLVPFTFWQAIVHIYGWVPFNEGCGAGANPLAETSIPGWNHADIQAMYIHDMQYNHFKEARDKPDLLFNPYVQLIHDSLQMNAYAFSVDDAVGFMSELGGGLNFSVGGSKGLENTKQFSYADGFTVAVGVDPDMEARPTVPIIKRYGVCVIGNGENCETVQQDVTMPGNSLIPGFRVGTVASYPIKVGFTDLDDNVYTFEVRRKFTECPVDMDFKTCNENNKDVVDKTRCLVTTSNGTPHVKSKQWCDGAVPNQAKDNKEQQLTKNFISFGVPANYLP